MNADSPRSASDWVRGISREFACSALGASAIALRNGPRAFLRTLNQSGTATATLSQLRGGAMASAAVAIGGVAVRHLRERKSSAGGALREIAHEGVAETVCGGASALAAGAAGLLTSKAVSVVGITGIKGSILLIGVPLTSAVITTVVVRHVYDQRLGARLDPSDPGEECCA